ncbi:MAG: hypothetical protein KGO82_06930 [Bacteroidota bacterium]|nr:hypothetical protein [Bacteroidota bacterium]
MPGKKFSAILLLPVVFTVTALLVFLPILGNTFLSDDYDSLYRIVIQKRILYREFLRPMIDVSFLFNYRLSGLSPFGFYLFNLLIHIINSLLVVRLVRQNGGVYDQAAIVSGLLFLVYPFHNEGIVWLSGRLSSMACMFALLAMSVSIGKPSRFNLPLAILFYLLGMLCYESIILLPIMIVLIRYGKTGLKRVLRVELPLWLAAALVYPIARFILSGEIVGSYASRVTNNNLGGKLANIVKVTARLLLPPSENTSLLVTLAFLFAAVLAFLHWRAYRQKSKSNFNYTILLSLLFLSLVVPWAFGVSTRTSEGDRLLYFPSVFICILLAVWLQVMIKSAGVQNIVLGLLLLTCIVQLEVNNLHWKKASAIANQLKEAAVDPHTLTLAVVNLPGDYKGAFIFRNGFKKMLSINKVNVQKVKVLSEPDGRLNEYRLPVWQPGMAREEWQLPPFVVVSELGSDSLRFTNSYDKTNIRIRKKSLELLYWNNQHLFKLL